MKSVTNIADPCSKLLQKGSRSDLLSRKIHHTCIHPVEATARLGLYTGTVYTVYLNQQLTDNENIAWAETRMRKECRAHMLRKVVVWDDAVVTSTIRIYTKL